MCIHVISGVREWCAYMSLVVCVSVVCIHVHVISGV